MNSLQTCFMVLGILGVIVAILVAIFAAVCFVDQTLRTNKLVESMREDIYKMSGECAEFHARFTLTRAALLDAERKIKRLERLLEGA